MEERYKAYSRQIETHLGGYFSAEAPWQPLYEAMRYSLLGGGKRLRPVLLLEFNRASGGDPEKALPLAAAVEMIHSYSLIHDDLPAMDDDHLRRGRPTCHIQYGEATAILAGDALQAAAFRAVLSAELPEDVRIQAGLVLARAAGEEGMVAGQMLDLEGESRTLLPHELAQVYKLKTAALIQAAAAMGVISGGGSQAQLRQAQKFANALGLAFQIKDDILDCVGEEGELGKPIGSDEASGKTTFVTLYGLEKAEEMLKAETQTAKDALAGFFDETEGLLWLADWLLKRNH